jgi:glyoxylase-like metal-dependent hydrolase (beta-lactamase superfamily II)
MSLLKSLIVPVTPFQQNASIIYCSTSKKCAFVDPGGDIDSLLLTAKENDLIPEKILLTHGHIDHAGGAKELAEILQLKIEGPHIKDKFLLDDLERQGAMFGMISRNCMPDKWLNEGDEVTVGDISLEILFCPGHTPGHIVFYNASSKFALVGDVLFKGSIGRTDLPGGNHQDLLDSIVTKLWPLGNDVEFIPGHGPVSNFGLERMSNAFVADSILSKT